MIEQALRGDKSLDFRAQDRELFLIRRRYGVVARLAQIKTKRW